MSFISLQCMQVSFSLILIELSILQDIFLLLFLFLPGGLLHLKHHLSKNTEHALDF